MLSLLQDEAPCEHVSTSVFFYSMIPSNVTNCPGVTFCARFSCVAIIHISKQVELHKFTSGRCPQCNQSLLVAQEFLNSQSLSSRIQDGNLLVTRIWTFPSTFPPCLIFQLFARSWLVCRLCQFKALQLEWKCLVINWVMIWSLTSKATWMEISLANVMQDTAVKTEQLSLLWNYNSVQDKCPLRGHDGPQSRLLDRSKAITCFFFSSFGSLSLFVWQEGDLEWLTGLFLLSYVRVCMYGVCVFVCGWSWDCLQAGHILPLLLFLYHYFGDYLALVTTDVTIYISDVISGWVGLSVLQLSSCTPHLFPSPHAFHLSCNYLSALRLSLCDSLEGGWLKGLSRFSSGLIKGETLNLIPIQTAVCVSCVCSSLQ